MRFLGRIYWKLSGYIVIVLPLALIGCGSVEPIPQEVKPIPREVVIPSQEPHLFECDALAYQMLYQTPLRAVRTHISAKIQAPREALANSNTADEAAYRLALSQLRELTNEEQLEQHEQAEVANLMAYAFYLLDDHSAAVDMYKTVFDYQANRTLKTRTLKTIAQLHLANKEFEQSLQYFQEYACLRPELNDDESRYLAFAYESAGDHESAVIYAERALAKATDRPQDWRATVQSILDGTSNLSN